ncbi:MAG: transposase [Acidobacteriaceae bacterium]
MKYHAARTTKYRYKVLRGEVAEWAGGLIRQIRAAWEVTIMRGAVSPDHIHFLVEVPPQLASKAAAEFEGALELDAAG